MGRKFSISATLPWAFGPSLSSIPREQRTGEDVSSPVLFTPF
jgi:hypothetical protein